MATWRARNDARIRAERKARYAGMTEEERAAKLAYQKAQYQEKSWRWRRDRMLKKYGMSMQDYEDMVRAQGNRCAICGSEPDEGDKGVLHVDHCHASGRVRGLLCTSCNNGLGRFGDDPARLARAITYLTER